MQTARDVLTPDALGMLQAIETAGSFAAAARAMGMVPSALTYRVRQIEDALDVLLYDRSSRQAKLTRAGTELLRESARLLMEIDAVANRVKRGCHGLGIATHHCGGHRHFQRNSDGTVRKVFQPGPAHSYQTT